LLGIINTTNIYIWIW